MYACLNLTEGDFHSKSDFEVLFQISAEYKLRASSAYRGQAMKSLCEFVHSSFFLLKKKKSAMKVRSRIPFRAVSVISSSKKAKPTSASMSACLFSRSFATAIALCLPDRLQLTAHSQSRVTTASSLGATYGPRETGTSRAP